MKVGIVVGSYGTPEYLHLHLEGRRRGWSDVPLLVHNDGDDKSQSLARMYGADFFQTGKSCGHLLGDTMAFLNGLVWAEKIGLDWLIKMSVRFVPMVNPAAILHRTICLQDAETYTNYDEKFAKFWTGCFVMKVSSWATPQTWRQALTMVRDKYNVPWQAEDTWARMADERGRIGRYPMIPATRNTRSFLSLWYSSDPPESYAAYAASIGLDYTADDYRSWPARNGRVDHVDGTKASNPLAPKG